MSYRLDMTLRPEVILRALVNYRMNTNYKESQLIWHPSGSRVLSKVLQDTLVPRCDTYALAEFANGVIGQKTYTYLRVNLDEMFDGQVAYAPADTHIETDELLPYIAADLGVSLTRKDIVPLLIPEGAVEVDVLIAPRHLTYKGKITVALTGGAKRLVERVLITDVGAYPTA
ncbi:hypothetical protein PHOBOS_80 [Erwinia phage vB_EamM_Phobos]|uniref:virion structural protein n=1 Tax=Erwinia phage vB_EamM_Phobos TaxID=1883377 RepID=UPI00081CBC6F|nr:virion structural protein [Erwinia phage vB_EamM_Phobos]ANZ50270.1 hypothetical protein PHOBOS_80 [Erwinia phage vB_EamM_Phobos]